MNVVKKEVWRGVRFLYFANILIACPQCESLISRFTIFIDDVIHAVMVYTIGGDE